MAEVRGASFAVVAQLLRGDISPSDVLNEAPTEPAPEMEASEARVRSQAKASAAGTRPAVPRQARQKK